MRMGNNRINGAEAGKALGDALAANTMLKELDLSRQGDIHGNGALDAACAKELAIGLGANGAMTSLDIRNNNIRAEGRKAFAEALKDRKNMKELNIG